LNESLGGTLKRRLTALGLSDAAIEAAWPKWWTDDAQNSPSATLELYFSIARKLGIDPRSLYEGESPRFVWQEQARFKHLTTETLQERAAISSFGRSVGALLVPLVPQVDLARIPGAAALRDAILGSGEPFVTLANLLSLCWGLGIPVVHLRVTPWSEKRMAAMAVRIGERSVILLARDSIYPATIAFYVAHELGHVLLGHLGAESAIVDLGTPSELGNVLELGEDIEERAADRFALELLTGSPDLSVLPQSSSYNAPALAAAVLDAAPELKIEPGTLALAFGFSTKNWAAVNSAMKFIYRRGTPVWRVVNEIAVHQVDLTSVPRDSRPFLESVLGLVEPRS
jgi:hypothetical protein